MRRVVTAGLLVCVASLLAATTAAARGADRAKTVRGTCTGAAASKLKVKADDGRLEIEFEVDQNRVGRRWRVVLRRNGAVVFRGVRTTTAPSGSLEVRRSVRASARSTVAASARALVGGQTCRATATA